MKKIGLLNKTLSSEIAGLGHLDSIIICNAGFPIPKDVLRIDISLTKGIPSFMDALRGVLSENVVEKVAMSKEGETVSPELYADMKKMFKNQEFELIPHAEFKERSKNVKFILRTGDYTPYASIMLFAASQSEAAVKKFDIVE